MGKKPKSLIEAAGRLQQTLPDDMYVGSGYGIEPGEDKSLAKWKLYVWTKSKDTSVLPKEFKGYTVVVRDIPVAYKKD